MFTVLVIGPPGAGLRARIVEREPSGWSGLEQLVAASQELAGSSKMLAHIDLVLSTEGASPSAIAERIREARPSKLTH